MKQRGMTLLEIIIIVGVIVGIISVMGAFQADIFSYNRTISTSLKQQNEIRKILNPFAAELRSATESEIGDYPIDSASSTAIVFFSNIDDDEDVERVRYFLQGNDFKKGVIKPTPGNPASYNPANETVTEVVHDIVDLGTDIFRYYDSTFVSEELSTPLTFPLTVTDISLIKVTVSTDDDLNKDPSPATVSTLVTVRNLQDNI